MKEVLNYNIHNILKISLEKEKNFDLMRGLDLEMSFFRVNEEIKDPDIIIKLGEFQPSNEDCYVVDHKYHIKENYIYCKDSADNLNWEIEIFGFENGKSIVNYNYNSFGVNNLISKFNFETVFLRPLIYCKLKEKKYFMVHGGSITFKDDAFLLSGCGGSYKTSIIMDLLKKSDFKYMGDDWAILHKEEDSIKVFSFPAHFKLFNYVFNNKKDENLTFVDKVKFIKSLWKKENSENVQVNDSGELKGIIFLNKSNSGDFCFGTLDLDDAINRLINNTKLEMNSDSVPMSGFSLNPLYRYITAYSYVFPDSNMAKLWKTLEDDLKEILNNFNFYELEIPDNYSSHVSDSIVDFIGGGCI